MNIVIFGLSVSSSWGNGHATLWRGLIRHLGELGHTVQFLERDTRYYRAHRDLTELQGGTLCLYESWDEARAEATRLMREADVAILTSYCPDGRSAADLILGSSVARKVFYDLDTPVTLEQLAAGHDVPYLPESGLGGFDLALSYTGGQALSELAERLGARRVAPLYGSVDTAVHRPVPRDPAWACDLSYLGTYAPSRQEQLEELFIQPARERAEGAFLLCGAQYPAALRLPSNIRAIEHLAPDRHPLFYSSSRFTLNITRREMAKFGYCPSGRLFEAAACGCPVLSDWWMGLEQFFTPGEEIVLVDSAGDVLEWLGCIDADRDRIAGRARERALDSHSAAVRAAELVNLLESRPGAAPTDREHAVREAACGA